VHHRIDDSPDDSRYRPNQGQGGRIILLGDGTELTTETPDAEMFDNDNEDKDLDSQVDRSKVEGSNGTPNADGPQTKTLHAVAGTPSSVKTDKSESTEAPPAADKDTTQPEKLTASTESQK
jgi:protein phosphatase 2C family protein 2/3